MLKNLKKVLSVVLVFCMIMSMLSMTALADEGQEEQPGIESSGSSEETYQDGESSEEPQADEGGESNGQNSEITVPNDDLPEVLPEPEEEAVLTIETDIDNRVVTIDSNGGHELTREDVASVMDTLEDGGAGWSVVIGPGITAVGANAFQNRGIAAVEIGANVAAIGKFAFQNCAALESVTFADGIGLTAIGEASFEHCTALDDITIPASVTTIVKWAFNDTSLANLQFAQGSRLQTIEEYAFACVGNGYAATGNNSMTSIEFPASLKTIENNAFLSREELESVSLPEGLETINGSAFKNCSLQHVVLPASLKTIGSSVFDNNGLDLGDNGVKGGPFSTAKIFFKDNVSGTWANSATFALNGGDIDPDNLNEPVRAGYEFLGWYSSADFAEESAVDMSAAAPFLRNTSYYAKWDCQHANETSEVIRAATCTTSGTRHYVCPDCGAEHDETIPSHGHVWSGYVTTQEPAVGVPGVRTSTCSICGATRTQSIPALFEVTEDPDDDVDIPDDEPPMTDEPDDVDIPDEEPPMTEEPDEEDFEDLDEEIGDDDTPLADLPDLPDEPEEDPVQPVEEGEPVQVPDPEEAPAPEESSVSVTEEQPEEDGEDIADIDVPLADVPQTGDGLMMWLSAAALSGAGLVLVTVSERKRKEQDAE